MFRYFCTMMLMLTMFPVLAAENPDIRVLMTPEEFAAAGLGSLSNEQIEAINQWLVRYTAEDAEVMISTSPAVRESARANFTANIDGEFNGWSGTTRFRLNNGQVWETNSTRRYDYSAVNPEVEFTRNWLGQYRMRIVETGRSIAVRRVQ